MDVNSFPAPLNWVNNMFYPQIGEDQKNPRSVPDLNTTKVRGPDVSLINCGQGLICFVSPVPSIKTQ